MGHTEFLQYLKSRKACVSGIAFVETCSSPQQAWEKCNRSDFMMWYLQEIEYDINTILAIACRCIRGTRLADGRTVWDLLTDERSRTAVETVERYIKGQASVEEVRAAALAARAADARAADAARAVRSAAAAPYHAARAAFHAVSGGDADVAARNAFCAIHEGTNAARAATGGTNAAHAQQADIIRELIPQIPVPNYL